ncbi:MAG: sensor histidine kinase [Alphaproteobacteria bacterium]|nr:sensor histidine kinase [Alphaproteobacteria bacterium]
MNLPNPPTASIRKRLVLLSGLWLAAALLATGLLLVHLFKIHAEEAFDAELSGQIEELAALADLNIEGQAAIDRPPADPRYGRAYSGWYWLLLQDGKEAARSRSLWDGELVLPAPLPAEAFNLTGPRGEDLRALTRSIRLTETSPPLVFLAAGPQQRIHAASWDFAGHIALTFFLLGGGLIAAILIQVTWGLKPLQRLRQSLAEIRVGKRQHLDGSFPYEISPLTDGINELLDHNAKTVERARTHAGNLAHALKTPLAALMNEAHAMPGPEGERLQILASEMNASITHHLKRARIAAAKGVLGSRTELAETASRLVQTIGKLKAGRSLKATLEGERGLWFQGERQDLEEMLGVLIENAFIWASTRVRVTLGQAAEQISVTIEDDGPGIPQERQAEMLERGKRLDESVPGSGLGLSIALDLAEAYGGKLELGVSELGGLAVRLELPKAQS